MHIDEERLVERFLELVRIDGPSKRERLVVDYIKGCLEGKAGELIEDRAGEKIGGDSGNIIARIPGSGSSAPVMFVTHLDTISSTDGVDPRIEDGYIRGSGKTVLGADDRAAISAVLEMVEALKEQGRAHAPLELVFTVAEELGLMGIKELDRGLLRSRIAYVLDSEHPPGTIITRGPYGEKIYVEVKGRAAHAGAEPEKGVSAIEIASRAIAKMRLGRVSEGVRANIGKISGGVATNIVPPSVKIQGEARGYEEKALEEQVKHMMKCFQEEALALKGDVDFKHSRDYHGFFIDEARTIFRLAAVAAESAGLETVQGSSCGASDANFLNAWGIEAVTLGVGYERAHSKDERIAVSNLIGCCRWIANIACMAIEGFN